MEISYAHVWLKFQKDWHKKIQDKNSTFSHLDRLTSVTFLLFWVPLLARGCLKHYLYITIYNENLDNILVLFLEKMLSLSYL